jgi:hypothetical protein
MLTVKGCPRSGTNLLVYMLRENGLEVAQRDKHSPTLVPGIEPRHHIVITKHPMPWCDSIYRFGWIFRWMREDIGGPLEPEEQIQSLRETVMETEAIKHWAAFHEFFLQEGATLISYEALLSSGSREATAGFISERTGLLVDFNLPETEMLMNSQPGMRPFNPMFYTEEQWRIAFTDEMIQKFYEYQETIEALGYRIEVPL